MIGKIFGDGESWNREDLFFTHEAHGFVAEVVGVVDGNYAGFGGVERAGLTGGVNRDVLAGAGGFFDSGAEFRLGVLERRGKAAVAKYVWARFVDFHEIGTFFDLLAYGGHELVSIIGVSGVGEDTLGGIEMDGVFVAAKNVDGIAADAHARAGNFAAIDGVADGGVRGAGTFRAHVALGGKSGHQVVASGERGGDGALGDGFFDGLQIFGARMQEKMDMGVDETGHESGVAEIEDFGGWRMLDRRTDFGDPVVLNKDFARGDYFPILDIENARGV